MTPSFDWDRDINAPISGRTAQARHASATGAQAARHGAKTRAYLRVLAAAGAHGLNDFDAGQVLGIYRTSVNSVRNSVMLAGLVEETGAFDLTAFGTKRQRYRVSARGRAFVEGL